jgi:5'-nucleotidase
MTRAPTRSGYFIDLLAPDPDRIVVRDISEGLAKINRWSGSTSSPISVAQHSLLLADLMMKEDGPLAALYGLLHDAHEYVIGDITEPTRIALERLIGPELDDCLHRIRCGLDIAIHSALELDWPRSRAIDQLLNACHARVVATEIRDLHADNFEAADFATEEMRIAAPLKLKIVPFFTWIKCESAFREALGRYHAQAGIRKTRAFMEE